MKIGSVNKPVAMGRYDELSSRPSPNRGGNFSGCRLLHLGRDQLSGFTDQLPGVSSTKLSRITQASGWGVGYVRPSFGLAEFLVGVANTLVSIHREWSLPAPSAQKLLEPEALKRFSAVYC